MYKLPKFDHSSILQRTEAYCSRHRTELTLSYALWLTGIDDAEEIYDLLRTASRSGYHECYPLDYLTLTAGSFRQNK